MKSKVLDVLGFLFFLVVIFAVMACYILPIAVFQSLKEKNQND